MITDISQCKRQYSYIGFTNLNTLFSYMIMYLLLCLCKDALILVKCHTSVCIIDIVVIKLFLH